MTIDMASTQRRVLCDRRGISEIFSTLIITVIIFTASTFLLMTVGAQMTQQTVGIVDAVRAQERRMNQLLSLIHAKLTQTGGVEIYIYNYGTENVEPYRVYFGRSTSSLSEVSYTLSDAVTGQTLTAFPPQTLVKATVSGVATRGTYYFVIITRWMSYYAWEVNL